MSLADEIHAKIQALEQEHDANKAIIAQQREIITELKSKPNADEYLLGMYDVIGREKAGWKNHMQTIPDWMVELVRLHDLREGAKADTETTVERD